MNIEIVTSQDINAWLELATEVEPLFGPMAGDEGFARAVAATVAEKRAFCVRQGEGLAGVVAVSRRENAVEWLAVSAGGRGRGCGAALLAAALAALDRSRPVVVQTFAAGFAAGDAARRLYLRAGFAEAGEAGLNPAGVPTVFMRRPPDSAEGLPGLALARRVAAEVHQCYWQEDINCARTVLRILSGLKGRAVDPQVWAAAAGLAGAGRSGAQCGLVEGGLMFIGVAGAARGLDDEAIVGLCHEYAAGFAAAFGSLLCRELRPEGFGADNPPHLCEERTVAAAVFAAVFMQEHDLLAIEGWL